MTRRATIAITLTLLVALIADVHHVCGAPPAADDPHASGKHADDHGANDHSVAKIIHHADTFYWISMQERGSLQAIELGLTYLEEAEHALADQLAHHQITEVEAEAFDHEIKALRQDLQNQQLLHHNTHYGLFPLARFVAPTLFSDPRASGSFELIDDPREIAAREAVEALVKHVLESQTVVPQYDVVFVSNLPNRNPKDAALDHSNLPNRELENEALYEFNRSARFFVHNLRELAKVLDVHEVAGNELWQDSELEPSVEILQKLLAGWKRDGLFRGSHLLLVRVREIDEYHGDYFYIAEARIFQLTGGGIASETSPVLHQYGFCIDRRQMLVPILALHGVLLVVSILLYPVLIKFTSHARRMPTWQNTLIFGGLGFLWGRGMIWIIAPMLGGIEPDAETPYWWSFWWPAAAGAVFTLGPAIVLGFADRRFNWFGSAFATFNRGGALFASISLGSAAFLAQCALVYKAEAGWSVIPPLVMAVVLAAFTVGRAMDKTDAMPLAGGVLAGIVTLVLGLTWCHANLGYLWLTVVPLVAITAVAVWQAKEALPNLPPATGTGADPIKLGELVPTNCRELAERAYNPPFFESPFFREVLAALDPSRSGETMRLVLVGPAGVGKSATLRALEAAARQQYPQLVLLKGTCDQPQEGSVVQPYEPFAEAIAEHFAVNLLAPHADQMEQVDEALGGIFDRVVPFADILFPPSQESQTGSKQELFMAIAGMLRRLATRHPVLLVLDDVHWMDPASEELLKFLLSHFPPSEHCPLAILLASRTVPTFDASMPVLTIQSLSKAERREILVDGLGLHSDVATDVLNAAGHHSDNLHWLFQMISHLAQKELLVRRDEGFAWKDATVSISEHMPDDYRQSIEQSIAENPAFRAVLDCAACLGQEFTIDTLSHGVGLPRLELIQLLDQIEEQTGIICDVRAKDDTFAFRSAFLLEVLRRVREVNAGGPDDPTMPQRIREFHARLGSALERTLDNSSSALYAVANHYYAAGVRHAPKALEYTIKAAQAASFQFQHDLARKYLAMAQEYAAFARTADIDFERELLLIQCHEAHVEGKHRIRTAAQALDYLRQHPDSDFTTNRAVAQACYDAGVDTHGPQHFADCVTIAREMQARFESPLQQAEAYHFWGIGLPRSEADERQRYLRKALDLAHTTGQADQDDLESQRLRARIAGSLAEQLSYGTPQQRSEARELFELSIEIKQREDIRDLEGLALAHGGLGRLAFFSEHPDFELARKHFEEDLRYSEKIGSITGQTKMHSLLGACIVKENKSESRFEDAAAHYQSAHAAAVELVDKLFALAGLLECHAALDDGRAVQQYGAETWQVVHSALQDLPEEQRQSNPVAAVPPMCRDNLWSALQACQQHTESPWYRQIADLLDNKASDEVGRTD